jgi:hypothetical protein
MMVSVVNLMPPSPHNIINDRISNKLEDLSETAVDESLHLINGRNYCSRVSAPYSKTDFTLNLTG